MCVPNRCYSSARRDRVRVWGLALLLTIVPAAADAAASAPTADGLLRAVFDNWRARNSAVEITMTIHRPDWQRSLTMLASTEGDEKALVRFTAPAEDAGNALLKVGEDTWLYNPRLNQVISLPSSMLYRSWMGSDFSYDDLSKANDILTRYAHRIVKVEREGDHTAYTVEAIPKPGAPVVWGKRTEKIRDDGVMLAETWYDQDMRPVRHMVTDRVAPLGGRMYPVVMSMQTLGEPGKWTRIVATSGRFNTPLPDYLFTVSNLRNRRD